MHPKRFVRSEIFIQLIQPISTHSNVHYYGYFKAYLDENVDRLEQIFFSVH